jgi:serine/threonine protein kinase
MVEWRMVERQKKCEKIVNAFATGMEAISLGQLCDSNLVNVLSLDCILHILMDICLGMLHAHSLNIAHRDMNLGNFLISQDGVVKVSDFGQGIFPTLFEAFLLRFLLPSFLLFLPSSFSYLPSFSRPSPSDPYQPPPFTK